VVAVYTRKTGAADEMHYLTHDHLGSVDSVTNASGAVEVRLSFGGFGQRRKEAGWSGNPTSSDWTEITDTTRRGFTFHETLDNLNLIHMNGRVYDQIVGRFISTDPHIPTPELTQSFNRLSYVSNRILSLTDPSGFAERGMTLVAWIDGSRPGRGGGTSSNSGVPGVEGVTVTASRWDFSADLNMRELVSNGSNFDVRSPEMSGGGSGHAADSADNDQGNEEENQSQGEQPKCLRAGAEDIAMGAGIFGGVGAVAGAAWGATYGLMHLQAALMSASALGGAGALIGGAAAIADVAGFAVVGMVTVGAAGVVIGVALVGVTVVMYNAYQKSQSAACSGGI
jgi:RHS repeat-associated protein